MSERVILPARLSESEIRRALDEEVARNGRRFMAYLGESGIIWREEDERERRRQNARRARQYRQRIAREQ